MRRSIGLFFATLALLIQAMAPVTAAAMLRAADPLADAIICTHDGGDAPAQPGHAGHDHGCAMCLVCGLGHAPPPGRTASAIPAYATAATIVWFAGGDEFVPARFAHDGQARGPPSLI